MTAQEAAEKWNVSLRWVQRLYKENRIECFMDCIPMDWNDGYDNVTVGCTVENQDRADYRLSNFIK